MATLKEGPKTFLETNSELQDGVLNVSGCCKESKFQTLLDSKIPKKYKRNVLIGVLRRSKRILSDFTKEKFIMKKKFQEVDFPIKFVNSVVKRFQYNDRTKRQQDSNF